MYAQECVGHHAIVLVIDRRCVDEHAATAKFLIANLHAPIELAQHTEGVLSRRQQPCVVFVGLTYDALRGIECGVYTERVGDEAGSPRNPAATSPCL